MISAQPGRTGVPDVTSRCCLPRINGQLLDLGVGGSDYPISGAGAKNSRKTRPREVLAEQVTFWKVVLNIFFSGEQVTLPLSCA
jgi:hypothetical protein